MFLRISIIFLMLFGLAGCQPGKVNKSIDTKVDLSEPNENNNTNDEQDNSPENNSINTFSIKGRVTFLSLLFSSAHANSDSCLSRCETQRCAYLYVLDEDQNRDKICESSVDESGVFDFKFSQYPKVYEGKIFETRVTSRDGKTRKYLKFFDSSISSEEHIVNEETTSKVNNNLSHTFKKIRDFLDEQSLSSIQQLNEEQRKALALEIERGSEVEVQRQCDFTSIDRTCSFYGGLGERDISCNDGTITLGACRLISCREGQRLLNGRCVNKTCSGNGEEICQIVNGVGLKSRSCTDGEWGTFGVCSPLQCNRGYELVNGVCTKRTCTGSSQVNCKNSLGEGLQKRRCIDGQWQRYGGCELTSCEDGYDLVNGICLEKRCEGDHTLSCTVSNGEGVRYRRCDKGNWEFLSKCLLVVCDDGYTKNLDGNCVQKSCEGETQITCAVNNGQGKMSRVCNSGNWLNSGSCIATSCNEGYKPHNGECKRYVVDPTPTPTPTPTPPDEPIVILPIQPGNESPETIKALKALSGCPANSKLEECNYNKRWINLGHAPTANSLGLDLGYGEKGEDCSSWLSRKNISYDQVGVHKNYLNGARQHFVLTDAIKSYPHYGWKYKNWLVSVGEGQCLYRVKFEDSETQVCKYGPAKNAANALGTSDFRAVTNCTNVSLSNNNAHGLAFEAQSLYIKRLPAQSRWADLSKPKEVAQPPTQKVGPKGKSAKAWLNSIGIYGEFGNHRDYHEATYESEYDQELNYVRTMKRDYPINLLLKDGFYKGRCPYEVANENSNDKTCKYLSCSNPEFDAFKWVRPVLSCETISDKANISNGKLFSTDSLMVKVLSKPLIEPLDERSIGFFRKVNIYSHRGRKNQPARDYYRGFGDEIKNLGTLRTYTDSSVEKGNLSSPNNTLSSKSFYSSGKCPYIFKESRFSEEMCIIASCEKPNPTESSTFEYYPVYRCDTTSESDETKHNLLYHDTVQFERPAGE